MAGHKAKGGHDSQLYDRLINAGAEISKTGGVRVELATLVSSETAQQQLRSIREYRERKRQNDDGNQRD